jgi:hypothetical protein
VFVQQLDDSLRDPARVAELDGEAQLLRQAREEARERARRVGRGDELRRELDEHGGQFFLKQPRVIAEFIERVIAALAERRLVRDLARELEREGEARGRAPVPPVDDRGGRHGVEGGIDLDRVEGARVSREHVGVARALRVEDGSGAGGRRHPVRVVPALTADARASVDGRHRARFYQTSHTMSCTMPSA